MIPLIIDSNIFFSAMYNPKGLERKILQISLEEEELQLFATDIFWDEIERNLIQKLGYSKEIVHELFSKFDIMKVPIDNYRTNLDKANALVEHKEDIPFVASAIYLNCPIWSGNEKHFKHLNETKDIVWFNTRGLINYLRNNGLIDLEENSREE